MPILRHYSYGPRKLNIILTQLRCNASFSNYDLCQIKILSNASCNCGAACENSHHFFFDCDKYKDNGEIIFNSLNLLTKGSDLLTYQENITIFKHAFKYNRLQKIYNCLNDLKNQHTSPKVFILFSFFSYIIFVYNHSLYI
jgi:hypothetical protein